MKGFFEVTADDLRRLIVADLARRGYEVDPANVEVPASYAVRVCVELGEGPPVVVAAPPAVPAPAPTPPPPAATPRVRDLPPRDASEAEDAPELPRPPPERKWNSYDLSPDPRLDPGEIPERRPEVREYGTPYAEGPVLSPENPFAAGAAPAPRAPRAPGAPARSEALLDQLYGPAEGGVDPGFLDGYVRRG